MTKIAEFVNRVDLDEVAHNEPPHLDLHCLPSKARFHVAVRTQINKFVFYFIVGRNVKFGCSEC